MRRTKRELEAEILQLTQQLKFAGVREQRLRSEVQVNQTTRIVAQRGLVPYVRSLERFDKWLRQQPVLRKELAPILQELGLWEIKLGYDPDKDLTLSAVSPNRV